MAKNLSKSGIITGQTIKASEISQSIDALTGTEAYNLTFSGSLNLTGSVVTGSISNAVTSSYAITASHALNVSSGGGGVGTLQQVMTSGSATTIAITGSAISASGEILGSTLNINNDLELNSSGHLIVSGSRVFLHNLPSSNPNVLDQLYTTDVEGIRVIAVSDG